VQRRWRCFDASGMLCAGGRKENGVAPGEGMERRSGVDGLASGFRQQMRWLGGAVARLVGSPVAEAAATVGGAQVRRCG
jgi:hypothetical protein